MQTIVIVGASARAAAQSARRAGMTPWAADLFADLDLKCCCDARRVDNYPAGIFDALRHAPPGPWIYVGALENHADLIDRIAAERPLLGIQGTALRAVRDPFRLAAVLSSAGFLTPRISRIGADVARDGSWLVKPIASAGGFRIRHWLNDGQSSEPADNYYLQQFIGGDSVGAAYVGDGAAAQLLGVTSQIIESHPSESAPFRYCGSVGPMAISPAIEQQFQRLGDLLAGEFKLRGLFGVDAILRGDDVCPLEVNPRYTASIEVLERACGFSAIEAHVAGCLGLESPPQTETIGGRLKAAPQQAGKRIVYAVEDCTVGRAFQSWAEEHINNQKWPSVADVPAYDTAIPAGRPICTVLAAGDSAAEVAAELELLCRQVFAVMEHANPRFANLS